MTGAVSVAFVTEASLAVGLGHLRRCQALAAALRRHGALVRFVIDGSPEALEPEGIRLDWVRAPALACAAVAESRADVAVVDSYRAAPEFLERLRSVVGWVVAIDDLADRPLPVHLVVNGAFEAERLRYRGAADTRFLLGIEYALLGPAFGAPPARRPEGRVTRVLVTLGGGAVGESLAVVVEAVRRAVPSATIDLALGPLSDDAAGALEGVTIHRGLPSLRDLMLRADLAVTAGGMTVYECLASGTPIVGVCLAANQRPNIDALGRAGLIVSGEPSVEDAVRLAAGDPALRRRMSVEGRRRVDGRGAERVAAEIMRTCAAAGAARGAR
jgi:spore coat polysaccharide biosynthesis predicted glycosyltransferase SpsG